MTCESLKSERLAQHQITNTSMAFHSFAEVSVSLDVCSESDYRPLVKGENI
jgi:hypothetical protein